MLVGSPADICNSKFHNMSGCLDQYKIGWNTFPQYLLTGNAQLYQDKLLADVSLARPDQSQPEAGDSADSGDWR